MSSLRRIAFTDFRKVKKDAGAQGGFRRGRALATLRHLQTDPRTPAMAGSGGKQLQLFELCVTRSKIGIGSLNSLIPQT